MPCPYIVLTPSPSLRDRLLQFLAVVNSRYLAASRCNEREAEAGEEIVVGGDAVVAFDAAAETQVEQYLFAFAAIEDADRSHQGTTTTCAVARLSVVDVPGVETERTVVAVTATGHGRADERFAMAALERLATVCHPLLAPRREFGWWSS
jgi:hypothetical protein